MRSNITRGVICFEMCVVCEITAHFFASQGSLFRASARECGAITHDKGTTTCRMHRRLHVVRSHIIRSSFFSLHRLAHGVRFVASIAVCMTAIAGGCDLLQASGRRVFGVRSHVSGGIRFVLGTGV